VEKPELIDTKHYQRHNFGQNLVEKKINIEKKETDGALFIFVF
jgi:hypothetical protein